MDKWRHPELREGEVFLSNVQDGEMSVLFSQWQTARVGLQAYDIARRPIAGATLKPVFVSPEEYTMRWGVLPKDSL